MSNKSAELAFRFAKSFIAEAKKSDVETKEALMSEGFDEDCSNAAIHLVHIHLKKERHEKGSNLSSIKNIVTVYAKSRQTL